MDSEYRVLVPLEVFRQSNICTSVELNNKLKDRYLLSNRSLSLAEHSGQGDIHYDTFCNIHISKFRFTTAMPSTSYFVGNKNREEVPDLDSYSMVCSTLTGVDRRSGKLNDWDMASLRAIMLLPRCFRREGINRFSVGDEVIVPILDKKPSKQSNSLIPILSCNKDATSVSIAYYQRDCSIFSISRSKNIAVVTTPDGKLNYHLGLLIEPLGIVPFLHGEP